MVVNKERWGFFSDGQQIEAIGNEEAVSAIKRGAPVLLLAEDPEGKTIQYKNSSASTKNQSFHDRQVPQFGWGQSVSIKGKGIVAVIDSINWHFKEGRYYYYLDLNGKQLKKRYFEEELEAA